MLTWPAKSPNEVLDYSIDWSARLNGDTIASSAWAVPAGMTDTSPSNTATTTTIWLGGGTLDTKPAIVSNTVTTASGRVMAQSVAIMISTK